MSIIVLDASVAAKFYVRERDSDLAQSLVDREFNFLVPDIFFSEVANAIRKQHREDGQLDAASVRLAIDDLLMIGAEPVASTVLLPRSIEIALSLDHSVYDCLYLALADRAQTVLVTADMHLVRKSKASSWANRVISLANIDEIV
jgi:predicted nucleic acid-binding protein